MSNFKNLKKLKEDMQLKNINKEYISLINQIGSNKIQLKNRRFIVGGFFRQTCSK